MVYVNFQDNSVIKASSSEVTKLRKEGQYQEAFEKAKILLQHLNMLSLWDLRAVGHAIVALKNKDPQTFNLLHSEVIFYAQEVVKGLNEITNSDFLRENLNCDGPDGYLAKNLFALCSQKANSKALAQAQVYVKQKNYDLALQCYADALQQGPLSVIDEEQMAWAIFHKVKVLLKDPKRNFSFISKCFSLFFKLTQLKKP